MIASIMPRELKKKTELNMVNKVPYSLRLHGVVPESIVDGPGLRYAVFVQGCPHHCQGCPTPKSHDPKGGYCCDTLDIFEEMTQNPLLSGITFSGGEPFDQAKSLCHLAEMVKTISKNVVIYSGYTMEFLRHRAGQDASIQTLLTLADMLIDGPYVEKLRNAELRFRGSENQRIWHKQSGKWCLAAL